MSLDNPWTKHRQSFWAEMAGSPNLAVWHRIYALAYGVHRRNGHASFDPGQIAIAIQLVDPSTGEVHTPNSSQISRGIGTAIKYGFLHGSSNAKCLVVPSYAIEGGVLGHPNERCDCH